MVIREKSWVSKDRKYAGTITLTKDGEVLTLCQETQLTLLKENNQRVKRQNG